VQSHLIGFYSRELLQQALKKELGLECNLEWRKLLPENVENGCVVADCHGSFIY